MNNTCWWWAGPITRASLALLNEYSIECGGYYTYIQPGMMVHLRSGRPKSMEFLTSHWVAVWATRFERAISIKMSFTLRKKCYYEVVIKCMTTCKVLLMKTHYKKTCCTIDVIILLYIKHPNWSTHMRTLAMYTLSTVTWPHCHWWKTNNT